MAEVVKDNLVSDDEPMFKDARPPVDIFELPTGWLDRDKTDAEGRPTLVREVELKEITGTEEDMLASSKMQPHQKMNNLMVACTNRMGDITDKQKIRVIINELVSVDRFFLVYKIREISLGKIYKFSAPCPSCSDDKTRLVDLSEVEFPALENPYKRAFEGVLPKSKKNYRWLVQNGISEEKAQKLLKVSGDNIFSTLIMQRLESINGKPATMQMVKELSSADRNYLRQEFEEKEGTVKDDIDIKCDLCGHEFKVVADIGRKEFFFPTL